ncbi:MAG: N-acetylmuramoyl-L-alanine amidase [Chloroflexi bacterium]|nr:N-acetylmuramoyl-L-alanine amidase [Chloroflexota bacterium]
MVRRKPDRWCGITLAAILALGLAAGVLGGCARAVGESPPSVSTTIVPTAAPAVESEGVAATGEPGPEGPVETPDAERPDPTAIATPAATISETAGTQGMVGARTRVIALDPGHGGPEVGAGAAGLAEKDVNLEIALKLAALLRAEGYRVVLTRDTDRAVSPEYKGGGYPGGVVKDLQARVDIANAASADLFISIHNNGSGDPSQSGTEVWYDPGRSFGDRNKTLAELVEESVVKRIRALGYPVEERGIKDDTTFRIFQGRAYNIYVLGAGSGARPHVPTQMPGVLGETLFLSNAGDVAMLRQEKTLDAIAAGYRDAIVAYFERYPD